MGQENPVQRRVLRGGMAVYLTALIAATPGSTSSGSANDSKPRWPKQADVLGTFRVDK